MTDIIANATNVTTDTIQFKMADTKVNVAVVVGAGDVIVTHTRCAHTGHVDTLVEVSAWISVITATDNRCQHAMFGSVAVANVFGTRIVGERTGERVVDLALASVIATQSSITVVVENNGVVHQFVLRTEFTTRGTFQGTVSVVGVADKITTRNFAEIVDDTGAAATCFSIHTSTNAVTDVVYQTGPIIETTRANHLIGNLTKVELVTESNLALSIVHIASAI